MTERLSDEELEAMRAALASAKAEDLEASVDRDARGRHFKVYDGPDLWLGAMLRVLRDTPALLDEVVALRAERRWAEGLKGPATGPGITANHGAGPMPVEVITLDEIYATIGGRPAPFDAADARGLYRERCMDAPPSPLPAVVDKAIEARELAHRLAVTMEDLRATFAGTCEWPVVVRADAALAEARKAGALP